MRRAPGHATAAAAVAGRGDGFQDDGFGAQFNGVAVHRRAQKKPLGVGNRPPVTGTWGAKQPCNMNHSPAPLMKIVPFWFAAPTEIITRQGSVSAASVRQIISIAIIPTRCWAWALSHAKNLECHKIVQIQIVIEIPDCLGYPDSMGQAGSFFGPLCPFP